MIDKDPFSGEADESLERSLAALRRLGISEEPSREVVAHTLDALEAASDRPAFLFQLRRTRMLTVLKVGCAALAIAGSALYFGVVRHADANTELEEAVQKLERSETLSFRMTIAVAGQKEGMVSRQYFKTPGLARSELEGPNRAVTVTDNNVRKSLTIDPSHKSALLMDMPQQNDGTKRDFAAMMIDDIRRLAAKGGEPAGQRQFGNESANGFRLKEKQVDYVVWVDPEMKVPVLIEMEGKMGPFSFHASYADFEFDPKLDDALFRLEVPAGYTTRKTDGPTKTDMEELVVRLLRRYTAAMDGKFPERLDDPAALGKALGTKKDKGFLDPEQMQDGMAMTLVAYRYLTEKDRFGYQPQGVTLGDASKIVFWYKPDGKELYRVVYGDLHIGDVSADKLPRAVKLP
jgi:outer membrane lipoprotein-sorting protein